MKKPLYKDHTPESDDDIRQMLIEACNELQADQEGRTAGDVIVKILSHDACESPHISEDSSTTPDSGSLSPSKDRTPDVKKIREGFQYTQDQMAQAIEVTPSTIKHWEQGIRKPKGPSKIVLEAMAIVAERKRQKRDKKDAKSNEGAPLAENGA